MTREHFITAYHYGIMDINYPLTCRNCVHSDGNSLCKLMIKWNCQDTLVDPQGKCFNHELKHNKPHEQLTLF